MSEAEQMALIEGILYVWGDPLPIEDLARLLERTPLETNQLIERMMQAWDRPDRGLRLRRVGDAVQLSTREEHAEVFEKLFGSSQNKRLSNSALETLAIIAYDQPVTRIAIDEIRGVKSSGSIDTLLDRGLIEEAGRLDQIGRPILYRTTREFLRAFALESLEALPSRSEVEAMWENENHENAD